MLIFLRKNSNEWQKKTSFTEIKATVGHGY